MRKALIVLGCVSIYSAPAGAFFFLFQRHDEARVPAPYYYHMHPRDVYRPSVVGHKRHRESSNRDFIKPKSNGNESVMKDDDGGARAAR